MTTRKKTATTAATTAATPRLDAMLTGFLPTLEDGTRWLIEGWAGHLRPANHQIHAANSWAKHEGDFAVGYARDAARMLTVARMMDFGITLDDALALLALRVEARHAKVEE